MEEKGRGKLYVVEGACDGIGKSTQYALLKERLEKDYSIELKELSMGMSNDYKIALEHGATMIRIGRRLFT